MKRYLELALAIAIAVMFSHLPSVRAQTGQVIFMSASSGTTVANCGTPTLPSICGVATGWFVWQNPTSGWVLIPTTAGTSGVTSVAINGSAAKTGAVTFTISGTTTAPSATANAPTVTDTVPTTTITAQ
jgi:hypothetical protein